MTETYEPITWVNDTAPALNAPNLNRIEVGIEAIDDRVARVERGIVSPVTVTYATSVVLNATQGTLFRCVATGDLTLDDVVGGTDGQIVVFQVQASGAMRTLSFTGSADAVNISAGQWWIGTFRYVAAGNTWLLDDSSASGGSGSSGGGASSALDIRTPVTVDYAATVTVNAALGTLFRIDAVGNLTLADPANGTDGQTIHIEVLATGGPRTVTVGSGETIAIPSGLRWVTTLRYVASANLWLLVDG